MQFDPYEELGVARNAAPEEVRKGYRRRARKTHPDSGGSPEQFARTKTALVVLMDPEKRRRYDETGGLDEGAGEKEANNDRAVALQMIEEFLEQVINTHCAGRNDARRRDLVAEFCAEMNAKIGEATANDMRGQKVLELVRSLGKRFTTEDTKDDPIGRSFRNRVAQIEAQRAQVQKSMDYFRLAIKIARKYRFERDPDIPAEFQMGTVGTFMVDIIG